MLEHARNIFIVGIKGVAMANLAVILKKMGKNVSGSDLGDEFITDILLKDNNISVSTSFEGHLLPEDTDLVIYSGAHFGIDNPQVKEAIQQSAGYAQKNIKIAHQAEIITEIMNLFQKKIAICGSHGKTSTASLLAYTLFQLKQAPSYLVGTSSFNTLTGSNFTNGDYFVLEADEYAVNPPIDKTPKLEFYQPNYILVTNIDFDHPDVYENLDEVKETFLDFLLGRKIIACIDDHNLGEVLQNLPKEDIKTYGYREGADLQIKNIHASEEETIFELGAHGQFSIALFGEKNISNVAGVVLILLELGFKSGDIKKAIKEFGGAKRRFDRRAYINNTYLFDDYAHHPAEIEVTIQAARQRFPERRIIIIFQPHTYSRTEKLLTEFTRSLSLADKSYNLPIFKSARENPEKFSVSSKDIVGSAKNMSVFESKEDLTGMGAKLFKKGDVIFTMGAGDIYKLEDDIIELIKKL